jgi:hypothetical protein
MEVKKECLAEVLRYLRNFKMQTMKVNAGKKTMLADSGFIQQEDLIILKAVIVA